MCRTEDGEPIILQTFACLKTLHDTGKVVKH